MYQALCWVLVGGAGFKKTVRVSLHGAEVLLEETKDHGTIQQVGWEAVKPHYPHFTYEKTKADGCTYLSYQLRLRPVQLPSSPFIG